MPRRRLESDCPRENCYELINSEYMEAVCCFPDQSKSNKSRDQGISAEFVAYWQQ